jgi:hypothetical protein
MEIFLGAGGRGSSLPGSLPEEVAAVHREDGAALRGEACGRSANYAFRVRGIELYLTKSVKFKRHLPIRAVARTFPAPGVGRSDEKRQI